MKTLSILGLIATFAMLETGYSRDVIHKGDVVVVPLRGEISPSLLMFLRRAEKLAETNAASAITANEDHSGTSNSRPKCTTRTAAN